MKRIGYLTLLTGLISLGLVARDLILAYQLGNRPELNEFLRCTIIPMFVINFLTMNLAVFFVPRLINANTATMSRYLRIAVKASLTAAVFMIVISQLIGRNIEAYQFMASPATVLLWVFFFLNAIAAVVRCFHNAKESYTQPLIANFSGSILTTIMFWLFADQGKNMLALSYVTGACLELILMSLKYRMVFSTPIAVYPPMTWMERAREAMPLMISALFISINTLVDQIFAAAINNKGLSLLLYSGKFQGLIMGTMGTAIGTVALTEFTKMKSVESLRELSHKMRRESLYALLAGLVSAILIWILAPYIVPIAFERGEFTSEDSIAVTTIVRFGIWILPPYFVAYYLKRYLMALKLHKAIVLVSGSAVIVNATMDLVLSRAFGLPGIALASVVNQGWVAILIIAIIARHRKRLSA